MAVGLLRRSIREEVAIGKVRPVLENTGVSGATLCPLGQSKKAIGHGSPIGPCIATLAWTIIRLVVSENDGRRRDSEIGTTGREEAKA